MRSNTYLAYSKSVLILLAYLETIFCNNPKQTTNMKILRSFNLFKIVYEWTKTPFHANIPLRPVTLCLFSSHCDEVFHHEVFTYVEYRAVSGVFQTIDPPSVLHPASVSSPQGRGYTLAGRWGGGGVNILEDARHWIGLLQYNPSTCFTNEPVSAKNSY